MKIQEMGGIRGGGGQGGCVQKFEVFFLGGGGSGCGGGGQGGRERRIEVFVKIQKKNWGLGGRGQVGGGGQGGCELFF